MSKSSKKSVKYMYSSLFLFKSRQSYENSMISIISLIYESGTYGSKWLKIVQMYGEKVVARYDPPTEMGVITPHGILKSWQLWCNHLPQSFLGPRRLRL